MANKEIVDSIIDYEHELNKIMSDNEKLLYQSKELNDENKLINPLKNEVVDLRREINRLYDIIANEGTKIEPPVEKVVKKEVKYKGIRGDNIDQMLADFVNQSNCKIDFERIDSGLYLFGTKRINIKILNGKLVVRVGGGFMVINEFISKEEDKQLEKMGDQDSGIHSMKKSESQKAMSKYGGRISAKYLEKQGIIGDNHMTSSLVSPKFKSSDVRGKNKMDFDILNRM